MKKNTKKIATMLLVAVVAVGSYFVSGTYAKYTSGSTGTATARVAKWEFKVSGNNISANNTFTFNLFDTLNEEDTTTVESDVVAANDTDKIIAPGTGGSFDIVLLNSSEVSAKYGIDYTVTNNSSIPVEFKVGDGAWSSSLTDVVADNVTTKLTPNGGTATITVNWRWAYERGDAPHTTEDANDTILGNAGTGTITVQADVTATQID